MRDATTWENHTPRRRCMTPRCGREAEGGRSRCRKCSPTSAARHGPNPYDSAWQRLRNEVLPTATHCGICGYPILPGQRIQLDHIKPRSIGGTSTRDNVQAAHGWCNESKKNRW